MITVAVIAGVAAVVGVALGAVVWIVLRASSDVGNPLGRCDDE